MILDACHVGAKIGAKGPKSMSEEFIRNVFEQAKGIAIISSCSYEQFSYEWKEKQCSVFTSYFLCFCQVNHVPFFDRILCQIQN